MTGWCRRSYRRGVLAGRLQLFEEQKPVIGELQAELTALHGEFEELVEMLRKQGVIKTPAADAQAIVAPGGWCAPVNEGALFRESSGDDVSHI